MRQQPELLAPAGSLETLKYAVMYGADAVYCALPEFGMRAAPVNLTVGELHEGCIFAHARGKKVYLTLNTLPTNEELSKLPRYIQDAAEAGVDAFIIADLGVLALAKKYAPQVERHVSTQAGITNYEAAKVCYELGAKRVVLARELPLTEIAQIRDNCPQDLELEAFVHGAMCMSVSGRCLLSSYMAGRSGNRGECAQPCRWKYSLVEEHRPGQYMEIGESEDNGSYILNANDLCTAPFIDLICKAGVDSLKIEGRAKTFYYVASVVSAYRRALDAFLADLAASGRLEALPEHLIDAGSAVAGCGGAFACLFMEGLADGAVTCGLPRDKANTFAAQMLLGAARLALESGKPFGQMKDEICSPGGTTIAGVRALEEGGLRAAAMNAVIAAYEKTLQLKK